MPNALNRIVAPLIGFLVGGAIGVFGAPAWEMAGLFVGPVAGLTAAITARLMATGRQRTVPVLVTIPILATTMAVASSSNPLWVAIQSTLLVIAAGGIGCLLGICLRDRSATAG